MTNTSLAKKARPLSVLVPLIKKELKWGFEAGQRHWQAVGRLLNEAKACGEIAHGEWQSWIAETFTHPMTGKPLALSTASMWMLADKKKSSVKSLPGRDLGPKAFTSKANPDHPEYKPKLDWQTNVRKVQSTIDVDRMAKEWGDKQKEQDELRKIAKKIIDAGYRALSAVVHPDKKGGSNEAFKTLGRAKKMLEEAIKP